VRSGQIPLQDGPFAVSIEGPAEKTVDIPLARAGSIEGRVLLVSVEANNAPAAEPEGLAGTIVETRQGAAVFTQVTDDRGRFRFEDLRPGRWSLAVDSEDLPELTVSEKPAVDVDVRPGLAAEASVRILQRRREIQFVDGGEITVDGGRKDQPVPPAPAASGAILLQAGSFSAPEMAERLRRSISDLGPGARVEPLTAAGRTLYRVVISCPNTAAAETLRRALRERGIETAILTPGRGK
jgi:hypothetical protein